LISRELNINDIQFISIRNKKLLIKDICSLIKDKKYLIVDDICDTGNTFIKVFDAMRGFDCNFAFLMSRYRDSNAKVVAKVLNHDKWVVFPWEKYK
jgi:uncharacterized protein